MNEYTSFQRRVGSHIKLEAPVESHHQRRFIVHPLLQVFLLWITRSKEQLSFHFRMLLNCTSCLIFYDGKDPIDEVPAVAWRYSAVTQP